MQKEYILLIVILAISLFLNAFGINWGLPSRWCADEVVAKALKMLALKTLVPIEFIHPTFYFYILILFLSPYFLLLKFTNYPFHIVESAGSISWIKLSFIKPDFATHIYLLSRLLSVLIGVACVYLVYLIAKKVFNNYKAGLFAAAIIAVASGFVENNHFARSCPLVNFLVLSTIYFCIKALENRNFERNIFLASFFGGLSLATKYNGVFLILPIFVTYLIYALRINEKNLSLKNIAYVFYKTLFNKRTLGIISFYVTGIILGWPTLVTHFWKYYHGGLSYSQYLYDPLVSYSTKLLSNFYLLFIHIFGLPLSIFIITGFGFFLLQIKKTKPEIMVLFSLIVPYFLFAVYSYNIPSIKYIIMIAPILAIFGGWSMFRFLAWSKIPKNLKFLILLLVFLYSIVFVLRADLVFVKGDTRYRATKWVLKNIPDNSSIELFNQIERVFSYEVIPKYNIIFYGTESPLIKDTSQFRLIYDSPEIMEQYFFRLNSNGASSDYIIIPLVGGKHYDLSELEPKKAKHMNSFLIGNLGNPGPEKERFMRNLLSEKLNYRMIKQFWHKETFFNPRPMFTSPTILVFKREK